MYNNKASQIILKAIWNRYHTKNLSKKKALDYYYANKEVISKKTKVNINPCHLNKKKKRQESTKWWLDKQSP